MSAVTIKTNRVPRDVVNFWEFSAKEQAELINEYSGTGNPKEFCEEAMWCRFKGQILCISEFMRIQHNPDSDFSEWDGYDSDSFFSGHVCRFVDNGERVVIGTYYS